LAQAIIDIAIAIVIDVVAAFDRAFSGDGIACCICALRVADVGPLFGAGSDTCAACLPQFRKCLIDPSIAVIVDVVANLLRRDCLSLTGTPFGILAGLCALSTGSDAATTRLGFAVDALAAGRCLVCLAVAVVVLAVTTHLCLWECFVLAGAPLTVGAGFGTSLADAFSFGALGAGVAWTRDFVGDALFPYTVCAGLRPWTATVGTRFGGT
jgi:hypothetical protein